MKDYTLRNHIPISGPATREPCDGTEGSLRVSLGFVPKFFHDKLGVDFSHKWHNDPVYRYETLVEMKTCLNECFPDVPYFVPKFENGIESTSGTISAVYGIQTIPSLYGIEMIYAKDDWPNSKNGQLIPKEELENLSPIDLQSAPTFQNLMSQMDTIEQKYGKINGYLNYQGILNIAFKLRGADIFTDMLDEPEFAKFLFAHIADTIMRTSKAIQARQRSSGFEVDLLSMSNCVMNMVSPDMYDEFIKPLDKMLSTEYQRFGIHTCNWNITPYIDRLSDIEKLGYIDMGMISDMKKVREVFPHSRRAVLYTPISLQDKSMDEIAKDIQKIYDELAPCDLVMADITADTPIEKVNEFLALADSIST